MQDFAGQLEGKSIFSKIDLVRAYNQVPMSAADIAKTAIITPFVYWWGAYVGRLDYYVKL